MDLARTIDQPNETKRSTVTISKELLLLSNAFLLNKRVPQENQEISVSGLGLPFLF